MDLSHKIKMIQGYILAKDFLTAPMIVHQFGEEDDWENYKNNILKSVLRFSKNQSTFLVNYNKLKEFEEERFDDDEENFVKHLRDVLFLDMDMIINDDVSYHFMTSKEKSEKQKEWDEARNRLNSTLENNNQ